LQHPQEAKHIKSSGRLLQLCLQTSRIAIAEQFDETELENWLSADNKQAYLLYPEEQSNDETRAKDALPVLSSTIREKIRLVLIDASWRQSRKMLRDNPVLQALPRYSLRDVPTSRYVIRQAHQVDQLSSLEACCYALMDLEKNDQEYQGLLDAFDAFNQMQIAFGVQRLQR
jgi:DTW domain-containing protein YfiP